MKPMFFVDFNKIGCLLHALIKPDHLQVLCLESAILLKELTISYFCHSPIAST
jgi:hypothetical protein